MKRVLAVLLAAALLLSLGACGSTMDVSELDVYSSDADEAAEVTMYPEEKPKSQQIPEASGEEAPDPDSDQEASILAEAPEPTPEPAAQEVIAADSVQESAAPQTPASGYGSVGWEDIQVAVVGAELFKDPNGKDSIRVYYDFTNCSVEPLSAWLELNVAAEQEGFGLVTTNSWGEVPEENNSSCDIMPGVTIRCIAEFNCKAEGEPVTVTLARAWESGELTVELDPKALSGRPGQREIALIENPDWMEGYGEAGVYEEDYYVKIDNAEVVQDYSGDPVLRVYYEFTNNSKEAISFGIEVSVVAMQDGIQVNSTWSHEENSEEDNFFAEVKPGETIRAADCYELRTDSPVTVVLKDYFAEQDTIGKLFPVK